MTRNPGSYRLPTAFLTVLVALSQWLLTKHLGELGVRQKTEEKPQLPLMRWSF